MTPSEAQNVHDALNELRDLRHEAEKSFYDDPTGHNRGEFMAFRDAVRVLENAFGIDTAKPILL